MPWGVLCRLLIAGFALAVIPAVGWSQRQPTSPADVPGFDPGQLFDRLARGRETVPIAEMPLGREQIEAWAARQGLTAELTRQQFLAYSASAEAQQAWQSLVQRLAERGRPRLDDRPAERRPSDLDARADTFFRRSDRNGDGVLSYEEMSDTLRNEREKWDTNSDGVIDLNEYREYIKAWSERRRQEIEPRPNNSPIELSLEPRLEEKRPTSPETPPTPINPRLAELDRKVTVYRSGKLPANLPAWFRELDSNGDAQVSLYEWKLARLSVSEFDQYDLNGDGFITVEELLRSAPVKPEAPGFSGFAASPTAKLPKVKLSKEEKELEKLLREPKPKLSKEEKELEKLLKGPKVKKGPEESGKPPKEPRGKDEKKNKEPKGDWKKLTGK